jgi:tetratricopeptide (TPR) repeat protein
MLLKLNNKSWVIISWYLDVETFILEEVGENLFDPERFAISIYGLIRRMYPEIMGRRLYEIGIYLYEKYYAEHAIKVAELSLPLVYSNEEKEICYALLGLSHFSISQYQQATLYFEQALVIKKENRDKEGKGQCYYSLGSAYHLKSDYQRAIDYYNQALAIAREIPNKVMESNCLVNIGWVKWSSSSSTSDDTKSYLNQALAIAREIPNKVMESNCLVDMGKVCYSESDHQGAIDYFHEALAIDSEIGNKDGKSEILRYIASVFMQMNELDKAYDYLAHSIQLSESVGRSIIDDHQKVGYYGQSAKTYEMMIGVCVDLQKKEDAFQYIERSKTKAFSDLLSTREIVPMVKDTSINKKVMDLLSRERDL